MRQNPVNLHDDMSSRAREVIVEERRRKVFQISTRYLTCARLRRRVCVVQKVKLKLLAGLRDIVEAEEVEVSIGSDETVRTLLEGLSKKWGEKFHDAVLDRRSGALSSSIRVLVNGENILIHEGVETKLREGDFVVIMPPAAGGGFCSG
ncbi:MAG: ubiquitin-like small modifier protein 1 [Candidatus Bathyarchaeia archaeon]